MVNYTAQQKETISILGCGWYGLALAKKLVENGYRVKGSTTSDDKLILLKEAGIEPYLVNFEENKVKYDADFFHCEILLISIPPKSRSPYLANFANKIKAIANTAEKAGIKQVIFISSTGVYADDNVVVTENDIPVPNTDSGKALFAAEEILKQHTFLTTTIIRFAGLIGPNRNLAKHFAGKKDIANGLAPINLIHLDDCLGLSLKIIKQKAFGTTYHAVAPSHPTRASFYTRNCHVHHLKKPHFINELLAWKQIESINVPTILTYQFEINDWDKWLDFNENNH